MCTSFVILDPTGFMTHPKHHWIALGEVVNLTCSFYNKTGQRFYWSKDGERFTYGLQTLFPWSNKVMWQLSFIASEPDMQGLYSCVLEDQLGNATKSKQASIRMKGKSIKLHK